MKNLTYFKNNEKYLVFGIDIPLTPLRIYILLDSYISKIFTLKHSRRISQAIKVKN